MTFWFIIILIEITFNVVVSISTENTTHLGISTGKNISHHLQNVTVTSRKNTFTQNQSFSVERYFLENSVMQDAVILVENLSLFISNVTIINTKITTSRTTNNSIFIENSMFMTSDLMINSASSVTIVESHFITETIRDNQEPNYVLTVRNVPHLLISNTFFGIEMNSITEYRIMAGTKLGINMENIPFAEIRNCMFTGIKSYESNGSAILVKDSEVRITSCDFHNNIAKYGVIYANSYVNLTTTNSSFKSNYADVAGAVFFLTNVCTLINDGGMYQNNTAGQQGAVVYAEHGIIIKNNQCSFQYNDGTVIWMQHNCRLSNQQVINNDNKGFMCGKLNVCKNRLFCQ